MSDYSGPAEAERARSVLLVLNPSSEHAIASARSVIDDLSAAGVTVRLTSEDAPSLGALPSGVEVVASDESAADGVDVVVVLGGDGTVLRAAERARASDAPLLGVNLGHVGFLAEAESDDIHAVVDAIVHQRWVVEERLALAVTMVREGVVLQRSWALNEVAIEKLARQRMVDVVVEVDGRPLSRWGCDGVVCATPTGSTAYAFSAGGPVVWPEVSAMLVVPLSAHALFARPLVVAPTSVVAFELGDNSEALVSEDGRRTVEVSSGTRIEVRQDARPIRFARISTAPFTDRLVAKFDLPVEGWRGRRQGSG